jgi:hypothetical protein
VAIVGLSLGCAHGYGGARLLVCIDDDGGVVTGSPGPGATFGCAAVFGLAA